MIVYDIIKTNLALIAVSRDSDISVGEYVYSPDPFSDRKSASYLPFKVMEILPNGTILIESDGAPRAAWRKAVAYYPFHTQRKEQSDLPLLPEPEHYCVYCGAATTHRYNDCHIYFQRFGEIVENLGLDKTDENEMDIADKVYREVMRQHPFTYREVVTIMYHMRLKFTNEELAKMQPEDFQAWLMGIQKSLTPINFIPETMFNINEQRLTNIIRYEVIPGGSKRLIGEYTY
jgi:hypothetical protein